MTTEDRRDDQTEVPGAPDAPAGEPPSEGLIEPGAEAVENAPDAPRAEQRLFGRFRRRGSDEPPVPPLIVEPPSDLPEPQVALRPAMPPAARQLTEAPSEPALTEDAVGTPEEAPAPPAEAIPSLLDPQPERDAEPELPPAPAPLPPLPPPSIRRPVPITAQMAVVTLLATAVTLAFVLIEPSPRWWLIVGAAAVVFGMDGVLRAAWREPFASGQETAPFLFLPALYMLATPVLIEHNARGEWAVLMALAGGLGFGVIVWGEVASVRPAAVEYPRARLAVTALAYFTAFAFCSLTYVFQIGLLPAMIAVGLAATMLSIELLREGEIDPLETMGFALIGGVVVAEGRWLIHYLPLDRYMAGLTLLVVFYLVTGIVHSYITRQFTPRLALETTFLAAAALALVVIARAGGMA